jgi:hypothetical protein
VHSTNKDNASQNPFIKLKVKYPTENHKVLMTTKKVIDITSCFYFVHKFSFFHFSAICFIHTQLHRAKESEYNHIFLASFQSIDIVIAVFIIDKISINIHSESTCGEKQKCEIVINFKALRRVKNEQMIKKMYC